MIEKIAFRNYRGSEDTIEAEIVVTVAGKRVRRRKRVPDLLTTPAAINAVARGKALSPSLPAWKWARKQAEKLITEPPKKKSEPQPQAKVSASGRSASSISRRTGEASMPSP
ncbi:MAG: hypothetical protein H6713_40570 [Myxococcales bacterium]|nr:hypothetical protein [Myxococcales bacterium]